MRTYRVVAILLYGSQWQRYASSWHRTLAEALSVFLQRQDENYDSVSLVPSRGRS